MLALFGAALLTVVGAGWYLGWYKVRSQPASVPGQRSVHIDINTNKIEKDLQKGEQRLQEMLDKKTAEAKQTGEGLTLPSPATASPNAKPSGTPLFQFHRDNGPSVQIGGDSRHPLIQIGGSENK
jgi:hypothetical protein